MSTDPKDPRHRTPPPIYIAIDTEFTGARITRQGGEVADSTSRVRMLDMSFAVADPREGFEHIVYSNLFSMLDGDRLKHLHETDPAADPRCSLERVTVAILEYLESFTGVQYGAGRARPDPKDRGTKTTVPMYAVILACHYGRADLNGFGDWSDWKHRIDAVRRTYCSINAPIQLDSFVSGQKVRLSITFRDTYLLSASGLDAIGDMLGVPKIDIEARGFTKARMDLLKRLNPKLYRDYAIRDAEITVRYLRRLYHEVLPQLKIDPRDKPATSSAIGGRMVHNDWKAAKRNPDQLLGFHRVKRANGEGYDRELNAALVPHAWKAVEAFQGGRNEAVLCGCSWPAQNRVWRDIDFASAYATAMVNIRETDWRNVHETKDLDVLADIGRRGIGIALVAFEVPRHVKHPPLPVRAGDRGLYFPYEGAAWATGPELWLARQMGTKIEVKDGIFVPWCDPNPETAFYPFAETMRKGNAMRGAAKKAGQPQLEQTIKLALNSIYGKTGQSVGELGNHSLESTGNATTRAKYKVKTGYDPRTSEYKNIPTSKLTQPWWASFTTGQVRAALCELMNNIAPGEMIANGVTDGICATQDPNTIPLGQIAQFMLEGRQRQGQSGVLLEPKGQSRGILSARTRCCVSLGKTPVGSKTMTAMGPLSSDRDLVGRGAPAAYNTDEKSRRKWDAARLDRRNRMKVRRAHKNRAYGTTITTKQPPPLAEQHRTGADFVMLSKEKRLQMDWDGKREPILETAKDVHGVVYFETRPWVTVEDAIAWRNDLDTWRNNFERVLKTKQDLFDFTAWRQAGCPIEGTPKPRKPKTEKQLTVVDHLARAWPHVRDVITKEGTKHTFTYEEVASELLDAGIQISEAAFKGRVKRAVQAGLDGIPDERPALTLNDKGAIGQLMTRMKPINLKWMLEGQTSDIDTHRRDMGPTVI